MCAPTRMEQRLCPGRLARSCNTSKSTFLVSDWKLDETDLKRTSAGITTVHARRELTVEGRLIMPEGVDAGGILVTGRGRGPTSHGDIPYARARRDGTFHLRVPSEHNYVLGIADLKWASDPWTGMILVKDSAKPAELTMKVYPATPLIVRVTRGPEREPVVNAWVDLKSMGAVNWTDKSTGVKISGTSGGVNTWLTTDADGVARAGVGKGEHVLRLSSGDWNEERTNPGDLRQACRSRVPTLLEWQATNYRPIDVRRSAV